MLRRLGPQPFPLPILFGDSGLPTIYLPEWEITRGEAESYDAYAALIAYNPEWTNIAAANASIVTTAYAATGYQGPYANDAAVTAALTEGVFTLTKSYGSTGDSDYVVIQPNLIIFESPAAADKTKLSTIEANDTLVITFDGTEYNYTVTNVVVSDDDVRISVSGTPNPSTIGFNADGNSASFSFNPGTVLQNASYFNTTDAELRETSDGGTTWRNALLMTAYTEGDVSNADFNSPYNNWKGEHNGHPQADNNAVYYNKTNGTFYVFVPGSTWSINTNPAALLSPSGTTNTVWLGSQDAAGVLTYFASNNFESGKNYYYYDTDLQQIRRITSFTPLGSLEGSHTLLSGTLTSQQARTYLDTGDNYDSTKTYLFYNGTALREVTAFTASVAEVVKLSNYMLHVATPTELTMSAAGVISGTLPVTSKIRSVQFDVDIEGETRKVRIPVTLTPVALGTVDIDLVTGHTEVTLSWDPVPNAETYTLRYREVGGEWMTIDRFDPSSTTETITGLSENTAYQFEVIAYAYSFTPSTASATAITLYTFTEQTGSGVNAIVVGNQLILIGNEAILVE